MQPSPLEKLWWLPLGTTCDNGSGTLEVGTKIRELLENLPQFSFIVVDMDPVDQLGGGHIADAVDGIVLVLDAERTRRSQARAAAGALPRARLLGAVLNKQSGPE